MQLRSVKSEHIRFANKYDYDRAVNYYHRYYQSPKRRLINYLEQQMAKRGLAMANWPTTILDIPCGTGRFWQTLKHSSGVKLHAADFNAAMLEVGLDKRDPTLTSNLKTTIASAFNLPFPDNSFESIFSMRFLHHINTQEDRLQLLRELARVTSKTVCISTWSDKTGLKGEMRLKKEALRDSEKDYNKFIMKHDTLVEEFAACGLELINYTDLLPHLSTWRLYALRKRQPTPLTQLPTSEYVCPVCKGEITLQQEPQQYVCQHDQLAFPVRENIPFLTQRDAIKLS